MTLPAAQRRVFARSGEVTQHAWKEALEFWRPPIAAETRGKEQQLGIGPTRAVVHEPAMLVWLDAPSNRNGLPNQKLARVN
jgi:hypothetical protein